MGDGFETKVEYTLSELSDCLSDLGFIHNNVWHFRNALMKEGVYSALERLGIEVAGTISSLRAEGVQFPDTLMYSGLGKGTVVIHRVTNPELNSMGPTNRIQNG